MKSKASSTNPGLMQMEACTPMTLSPILHQSISDLVYASPQTLQELVGRYGSPLNIVWPHILAQNVDAFRAVLHAHQVRYEIFYGAKVNKSQALVRAAVETGIGVDVSSIHEFRDALHAGADPARLCATGPAKTAAFHAELIKRAALISVDSVEELAELEKAVCGTPDRRARVLLRYRPAASHASRFGMGEADLMRCLQRLAQRKDRFAFEGFHFHLAGYAHETRAQALRELTCYIDAARGLGLQPAMIDIGGGMPIRYVDSQEYESFLQYQCKDHYRNGRVPASFYPYGSPIDAGVWLHRLLASPCAGGLSVAAYLNAMNLILALEPGRSLADQTAISVFRINCVKRLAAGQHVVFVEGSSFSACETWFASEFLVDPILVSTKPADERCNGPVQAYIAGHSCLDDDVLTNRLIGFDRMPQAGDLLVYANTAGYQMDLLENEFHRHPMPRRVAAAYNAAGGMEISPDDKTED
jgi:diaminopimelate decarboxylase